MIEMGVALTWGIRVHPIRRSGRPDPPSDISGQTWARYESDGASWDDDNHEAKLVSMVTHAIRGRIRELEQHDDERDTAKRLSNEAKRFIKENYNHLIKARLLTGSVPTDIFNELNGLGLIDLKPKGEGSWSNTTTQKPDAFYVHVTPNGSRAFAVVAGDSQDQIQDIVDRLRAKKMVIGKREIPLAQYLLERGTQLATGLGILDIPAEIAGELTIAGVVRVELVQGTSSPAQSIQTPAQNYYYLTDLGGQVLSRLREGNDRG